MDIDLDASNITVDTADDSNFAPDNDRINREQQEIRNKIKTLKFEKRKYTDPSDITPIQTNIEALNEELSKIKYDENKVKKIQKIIKDMNATPDTTDKKYGYTALNPKPRGCLKGLEKVRKMIEKFSDKKLNVDQFIQKVSNDEIKRIDITSTAAPSDTAAAGSNDVMVLVTPPPVESQEINWRNVQDTPLELSHLQSKNCYENEIKAAILTRKVPSSKLSSLDEEIKKLAKILIHRQEYHKNMAISNEKNNYLIKQAITNTYVWNFDSDNMLIKAAVMLYQNHIDLNTLNQVYNKIFAIGEEDYDTPLLHQNDEYFHKVFSSEEAFQNIDYTSCYIAQDQRDDEKISSGLEAVKQVVKQLIFRRNV